MTHADDPAQELPISGVAVVIENRRWVQAVHSDASGYFVLPIPWHLRTGEKLTISFTRPDYRPLELKDVSGGRLCIAHLASTAVTRTQSAIPPVPVANVVVKYSISTVTSMNVGSAVKLFEAANAGNVPCHDRRPCSPDGKWRAIEVNAGMDVGSGNEFHNARASCVAGPCPFTKVDGDGVRLSHDGRRLDVSVLNWSDTATFLLEAEVYKPVVSSLLRQSYPIIFDQALTFTLPAAEGVSIQADMDGTAIVFPLGQALFLSWANCQMQVNKDGTRVYRCQLKSGYRFAAPTSNLSQAN